MRPAIARSSASSGNTYGAPVARIPAVRAAAAPQLISWKITRTPLVCSCASAAWVSGSVEASSTTITSTGSGSSIDATVSRTSRPALKHGTMTATRGFTMGDDDGDAEAGRGTGGWAGSASAPLYGRDPETADAGRGPAGAGHRAAPATGRGRRAGDDRDGLPGGADRGLLRHRRRL